jgi:hypothetical protein
MTDFEAALAEQLSRNADLAEERKQAEAEMDRALAEREEAARRQAQEEQDERNARHAELAEHLGTVATQLKAASPDSFIVRTGWTPSGEEFRAKISTRQTRPARSLMIEVDRDDDQVMARWTTDVGNTVELWRLLQVTPAMLSQLVLQVADEGLWRTGGSPPAFPSA